MLEKINGYQLTTPLTNANSGFARWGFARKDGLDVFIKEFLSPVYPINSSVLTTEQYQNKVRICETFELKKRRFYNTLNKCSTGNLVTIADFFRYNSHYYMVTEKIDVSSLSINEVSHLNAEQKVLLVKTLVYNVNSLHKNGIVHGDLKPDNILIKRTQKGFYTSKLIDFDDSFLETNLPKGESDFHGDTVYLAPESLLYMNGETNKITSKIDVFALGILFHQYFTGGLPDYDSSQYDYIFEAALDCGGISVSNTLPKVIADLIVQMLNTEPRERPTLDEVFAILSERAPALRPHASLTDDCEKKTDGGYFKPAGNL